MHDEFFEDEPRREGRGRTAAKRAAKAVEETARQLVELPDNKLDAVPLDADLRDELLTARATRGHGSRKRQLKHFAALLRRSDRLEELDAFLSGEDAAHYAETAAFHNLEQLRDRLCSADTSAAALDEIVRLWPQAERGKLQRLARSVAASGDKRAYREIFRMLRKLSEPTES